MENSPLEILRQRIKAELKQRGMTQAELAQSADIREATLSQFLTGKREIGRSALMKVANALQLSLDSLLGSSYPPPPSELLLHPWAQDLVEKFSRLSPADKEIVSRLMERLAAKE